MTTSVERPYEVLGMFVSSMATFEFFINMIVETVSINHKITDHIQRQPVELRIEFIRNNLSIIKSAYDKLSMSDNTQSDYNAIVLYLDEIAAHHNKLKPQRDLIAHSPLFSTTLENKEKKRKIVSSRRYKPHSNNSLEIHTLSQLNKESTSKFKELVNLDASVAKFCFPVLGQRDKVRDFI